jgi:hypothetical protein
MRHSKFFAVRNLTDGQFTFLKESCPPDGRRRLFFFCIYINLIYKCIWGVTNVTMWSSNFIAESLIFRCKGVMFVSARQATLVVLHGSPVLGDRNTDILVLCTILV